MAGVDRAKVIGVVPPVVVYVEVLAVPAVALISAKPKIAIAALTAIVTDLLDVAPLASVAVMVYEADDADADGVPDIAPVLGSMLKPLGNDGEMVKVTGEVPPLAVTGVAVV